jgi:hypothetical protein
MDLCNYATEAAVCPVQEPEQFIMTLAARLSNVWFPAFPASPSIIDWLDDGS